MTMPAIESLREGDMVRWGHQVTVEDIDRFAEVSGDDNPIHMDAGFARERGFRGRVVHGMLLGAFLSRVLGTKLPGAGALWLSQSLRFVQPVYVNDRIEVIVKVRYKSESLRMMVLETIVLNERGATVLEGEAKMMMPEQRQVVPWHEMVAIVTGGSRGIGAAVAKALGARGARVVVNYRMQKAAAEAVVSSIESAGGRAISVESDVSMHEGAGRLADAVLGQFGRVDVVINNATPPIAPKGFLELTWQEMDLYLRTYVQSTFTLAQKVVPGMKERRFGRLVQILTSYVQGVPPSELTAYVMAKNALWGMTKAMSVELAAHGITVDAVSPSPVMTDQWEGIPESRRRALALRTPLRRLATPEDVARAVVFLVGDGGDFLTGVNLPVAGGEVM